MTRFGSISRRNWIDLGKAASRLATTFLDRSEQLSNDDPSNDSSSITPLLMEEGLSQSMLGRSVLFLAN